MIALVLSHLSDLEPQMAEQFPNKRKSTPEDCHELDLGLTFFFLLLGNCSAICGSRSKVRDEISATISTKAGSYFSIYYSDYIMNN